MANKTPQKLRKDIIAECANMVSACWQYYSDHRLGFETRNQILSALDELLPSQPTTWGWQDYADWSEEQKRSRAAGENLEK